METNKLTVPIVFKLSPKDISTLKVHIEEIVDKLEIDYIQSGDSTDKAMLEIWKQLTPIIKNVPGIAWFSEVIT